jgi:hypothetical protein
VDELAYLLSPQVALPFRLQVAIHHLGELEGALWQTVEGEGDVDTTCAIVGGIVALTAEEIPGAFLARREPLPPRKSSGFP